MKRYTLIYDSLIGDTSLEEAENILTGKLKLSKKDSENFFLGKAVIKSAEDKVNLLQAFIEKAGIKVIRELLPIDPAEAQLSHVYEKLLQLEEKFTQISSQLKSEPSTLSSAIASEKLDSLSGHLKNGFNKASSLANTFKETGQAKVEQLAQADNGSNVEISSSNNERTPENTETKKGFNWVALFGGAHYYSGYGKLQKGLVLACIAGLLPLLAIVVGIYAGVKANKELPVKKIEFQWPKFAITFLTQLLISLITYLAISGTDFSDLPSPASATTVNMKTAETYLATLNRELKILAPLTEGEKNKDTARELMADVMIQAQNDTNVSIGGSLALFNSYACLGSLVPNNEAHTAIIIFATQLFDSDYGLMHDFGIIDNNSYDLLNALSNESDKCDDAQKDLARQYIRELM